MLQSSEGVGTATLGLMGTAQRRFLICMTMAAMVCAAAGGVLHVAELALYLTPCFLIVALLLSGRFVGEERIVRRWRTRLPPPARRARPRWISFPAPALRSLLERDPATRRGPPVPALLAA